MNGDGETRRRWHQRPAMIPLATVIALMATLMGVAYGYGQVADRTVRNAERIDRIEERIEKQLAAISNKLDQLFQPRLGGGPAANRHMPNNQMK
ncbi:MAG: hypothetical protein IID33_03165 [Planctomycetes bacterium]|nr:hypothetical protein [Planctomycetota bacterium]